MTARFKYSKDPTEAVPLTFDFSPDLATGETLVSIVSVLVTVVVGTDPSPSAIFAGGNAIDSTQTKVSVPVIGGLDQVDYEIKVKATTTNAVMSPVCVGILAVRA